MFLQAVILMAAAVIEDKANLRKNVLDGYSSFFCENI